jgi:predicted secreted protein
MGGVVVFAGVWFAASCALLLLRLRAIRELGYDPSPGAVPGAPAGIGWMKAAALGSGIVFLAILVAWLAGA